MNAAKPCKDRMEAIMALVMGELAPTASRELQEHMAACDKCRAARDVLREEEDNVRLGFEAFARSLAPVERAVLERQSHPVGTDARVSHHPFLKRIQNVILAHKRLSIAAAAVTALAAGLIVHVSLFSSATAVYALDQTVAANSRITSYHVKITPAEELGEAWVELKPDGTPLRARMDMVNPDDGPKVAVLTDEKAEVWLQKKNSFIIIRDKRGRAELMKMRVLFDPKLAFEEIQEAQRAGKAQVETREPAKAGDPVTLTVIAKAAPDRREVYEVDLQTKLVRRATVYQQRDGQWKQVMQREYLDYNRPIDPQIFHPKLPDNIEKIDQIHDTIGVAQGALTDDEVATKAVREFFTALIAKDYKTAGTIFSGASAGRLEEVFRRAKFLRIVEIGKPVPVPKMKALQVPVKVEWEAERHKLTKDGSVAVRTTDKQQAAKTARDFLEALVKEDDAAIRSLVAATGVGLQKPMTVEDIDKVLARLRKEVKLLRIVEIGQPTAGSESGTLEVPVKLEIESRQRREVREFKPFVRRVYSQPDRWEITGGI
jgi:hypothetical protein